MQRLSAYLRMLVFMAGVLIGIQVPGFVDQYGKVLRAHQLESAKSLAAFQDEADRYFDGDLEQLAAHYHGSNDEVFQAGGDSITTLIARHQQLTTALKRYESNAFSPYLVTLLTPQADIRKEVLTHYTYTVILKPEAILVGLGCGLLAAVLLDLLLFVLKSLFCLSWRKYRAGRL